MSYWYWQYWYSIDFKLMIQIYIMIYSDSVLVFNLMIQIHT